MADATLAGFRTQFPSFTAEDGAVDLALEEAMQYHSINPLATLFCTAHILTLDAGIADGSAGGGEVASEGAGPLRVSYVTQAVGKVGGGSRDSFFTSTAYGQRFLALERRTPRTAIGALVAG